MNKPYTCHNCGTEFDALPSDIKTQLDGSMLPEPARVTVKCPGCYANGYTEMSQMIYTLDISADTPTLVAADG